MNPGDSLQCDVLVVGGGVSGIAAAVGASRVGAKVALVEKYGFMGGIATAGMVSTVCGAYIRSRDGQARFVSQGFVREFTQALASKNGAEPLALPSGLFVLPYEPWHMVRLADEYIQKHSVAPLLHSHVVSVEKEGGRVSRVLCMAWNSMVSVEPACLVDCTGEAIMVSMAGGGTNMGKGQEVSVLFRIGGLETTTQAARLGLLRKIIHAAEKGQIHEHCQYISFVPGHIQEQSLLAISFPREEGLRSVSDLELHGRRLVEEVVQFLVAESLLPPSVVPLPATQIGIRLGRLARGRSVLTAHQVLAGEKNDQGVARGCWPLEIWKGGRKPQVTHLAENDYYDIPAGCLMADSCENVFMGGRCISCSEDAMGSARVIGTALGTGYGAGTLAAYKALGRKQDEAIELLREQHSGIE